MLLRRIVSIGHRGRSVLRRPLICTCRTLGQLPLVAKQTVEIAVVPLHRVGGPGALQTACDRGGAIAGSKSVLPAEPLFLEAGALGLGAAIFSRIGRAMRFPKGVAAGN